MKLKDDIFSLVRGKVDNHVRNQIQYQKYHEIRFYIRCQIEENPIWDAIFFGVIVTNPLKSLDNFDDHVIMGSSA